jgi:hypothetical protein
MELDMVKIDNSSCRFFNHVTDACVIFTEGNYILKPEKEPDPSATPPAEEGEEVKKLPFRQGQGVYKLDGNIYEGEWLADKMHGRGKLSYVFDVQDLRLLKVFVQDCSNLWEGIAMM